MKDYLHRKWSGSGFVFRESSNSPHAVEIRLPSDLRARLLTYVRDKQLASGTGLTDGRHATYVFSRNIVGVGRLPERITQFHPLVRFIGSELEGDAAEFCPLVAVQLSSDAVGGGWSEGVYVFVLHLWHFSGAREVAEFRARAMRLNADGQGTCDRRGVREFDLDQSLDLVSAAKAHGTDWHSAGVELSAEEVEAAISQTEDRLQVDYEQARRDRENANNDRVDIQVEILRKQMRRQTESQERLLARYREAGNKPLVAMTEGRLRKVHGRFETHVADREARRQLRSWRDDLCVGVVQVVGS